MSSSLDRTALEKQQNRERGRIKAKEIALERARAKKSILLHDGNSNNNNHDKRKSTRHGARNQNRHQKFTQWLLKTFPHILHSKDLEDVMESNEDNDNAIMFRDQQLRQQQHVLDVAGGKGELAARLVFCHNISVTMVDPRKANVRKCFEEVVFKNLPKRHQESYQAKINNGDEYLIESKLQRKFMQLVMPFQEDMIIKEEEHPYSHSNSTTHTYAHTHTHTHTQAQSLRMAIQKASLLVGMHADGATEAIVNVALQCSKPFVVVPCCVFPNLFVHRMVKQNDGTLVQVRTHEQFCQYLQQKDERFVREVLPFDGRNVAIWWDGKT